MNMQYDVIDGSQSSHCAHIVHRMLSRHIRVSTAGPISWKERYGRLIAGIPGSTVLHSDSNKLFSVTEFSLPDGLFCRPIG